MLTLATLLCPAQSQFGSGAIGSLTNKNNGGRQSGTTTDDDEDVKPQPVGIIIKDQGLSFGFDVAPIIMRFINKEQTGLAFNARYGFAKRWWAGAEAGYENVKYDKQDYSYESNGMFLRIGADYDIFMSRDYPTNNNILIGARYGYAWQNHESSNFEILDTYWGSYKGSVKKTPVNSHWLEALFGLRCEMLPNIYMAWSFRCKVRLTSTHSDEMNPYAIAGLGKYDSRVALGFTYTFEFQIPTNRKSKKSIISNPDIQ